jgi:hypothetical protein
MTLQANLLGTGEFLRQAQSVGILANNLTALGSSLATALVLPSDFNVLTTVAGSTGVTLPGTQPAGQGIVLPGDTITVVNHGANSLSVYPFASTGKIANGSAGAALALPQNKTGTYTYIGLVSGADSWAASISN